ncbi:hypothetical protein M8C21_007434 [Ambrosia artemisiifolia]|uniref:Pentatricopeptide repeat-containing protein n=1 Tax=Ambrosia artemisiifolia TaxID=4212 RepID=A0AAD5D5X2_AMBAR|nr:hypothetical protein M8C21_007434 [Ambrosia artemisiifolia]
MKKLKSLLGLSMIRYRGYGGRRPAIYLHIHIIDVDALGVELNNKTIKISELLRTYVIDGEPNVLLSIGKEVAMAWQSLFQRPCRCWGMLQVMLSSVYLKVENALIDMYAKLGCLEYVSMIFSKMKAKDIVSWTAMILGYSLHGQGFNRLSVLSRLPGKSKEVPALALNYH